MPKPEFVKVKIEKRLFENSKIYRPGDTDIWTLATAKKYKTEGKERVISIIEKNPTVEDKRKQEIITPGPANAKSPIKQVSATIKTAVSGKGEASTEGTGHKSETSITPKQSIPAGWDKLNHLKLRALLAKSKVLPEAKDFEKYPKKENIVEAVNVLITNGTVEVK